MRVRIIPVPRDSLLLIVGAIFNGRFDGCSFPTIVHFGATDCKDGFCGNTFIPNYLCDTLRLNATHYKVVKNRLKIRRGQPRGGSTPPPGTKQNKGFRFIWHLKRGEAKIA